jgi:hypothetical protein
MKNVARRVHDCQNTQPVVEGRWRREGHCNTGALHRRVGRRRRIEGGVVGVECWTLGKSEEVGMVRMAKSGTSEGVVKWVDNMDSESKETQRQRGRWRSWR